MTIKKRQKPRELKINRKMYNRVYDSVVVHVRGHFGPSTAINSVAADIAHKVASTACFVCQAECLMNRALSRMVENERRQSRLWDKGFEKARKKGWIPETGKQAGGAAAGQVNG
jgi:hypothetical protein